MTEEKLDKGRDLLYKITSLEYKVESLQKIVESNDGRRISNLFYQTLVEDDEKWLLDELLTYRKNKLIALKKEFELL